VLNLNSERRAGEACEELEITRARRFDHVAGQGRRWCVAVPAFGFLGEQFVRTHRAEGEVLHILQIALAIGVWSSTTGAWSSHQAKKASSSGLLSAKRAARRSFSASGTIPTSP